MTQFSFHEPGYKLPAPDQRRGTWRGGTLRTLYQHPPQATNIGEYDVWVNLATIEHAADYSYMPGYTRVHLPIAGDGLSLYFQEPVEEIQVATFAQITFDGARPLHAVPIGGMVTAFNLILREGWQGTAHITHLGPKAEAIEVPVEPSVAGEVIRVIYVQSGEVAIGIDGQRLATLQAGEAYVFHSQQAAHLAANQANFAAVGGGAIAVVADLWR